MELGDIIYILVLFSFFIFGIIKDIKKKEASKQQKLPQNFPNPTYAGKKSKPATASSQKKRNNVSSPPVPEFATNQDISSSMQPSYTLEGSSSLQERQFSYKGQNQNDNSFVTNNIMHPILKELTGENRSEELRKAVIYNEIINRKY